MPRLSTLLESKQTPRLDKNSVGQKVLTTYTSILGNREIGKVRSMGLL